MQPNLNSASVSLHPSTTDRDVFLKLELLGDTRQQLDAVQRGVYHVELPEGVHSVPASNPYHWKTTDDLLYSDARRAYDNITSAFLRSPRVYKLKSIRNKVWESSHSSQSVVESADAGVMIDSALISTSKKKKRRRTDDEPLDQAVLENLQTYIDPFVAGQELPLWQEKLQLLEKLTPREDLDGYEYREDYYEQQYRFSLQKEYQDRLLAEVHRRVEFPTDLEQVEDVLYDLVELVADQDEAIEKKKALEEQRKRNLSNPITQSKRLRMLRSIEAQDGTVTQIISDMDFVDAVVTAGGCVLPKIIPSQLIAQHREEKRMFDALKQKHAEATETERRKPLTSKLRSAVLLAKEDLRGAVRQLLNDIADKTLVLPTRPVREKCIELVNQTSKGLIALAKDPQAALDSLSEYLLNTYDRLAAKSDEMEGTSRSLLTKRPLDITNKDLNAAIAKLKVEARRRMQEGMSKIEMEHVEVIDEEDLMKDVPLQLPDALVAKFLVHFDPPPAYVFRPKRTAKKELKKLKRKTLISVAENKARLLEAFTRFLHHTGLKPLPPSEESNARPSAVEAFNATEEKKDHSFVDTRAIVGAKNFTGFLKPEHMFVFEEEDEQEDEITFVYDASNRKDFESRFLEQLAFASCLPVENVSIEQIRRLEPDNSPLVSAVELKARQMVEYRFQYEIQEMKVALEKMKRKALSKGIIIGDRGEVVYAPEMPSSKLLEYVTGKPPQAPPPASPRSSCDGFKQIMDLPSIGMEEGDDHQSSLLHDGAAQIEGDDVSGENTREEVEAVMEHVLQIIETNSRQQEWSDEVVRAAVSCCVEEMVELIERQHQLVAELGMSFSSESSLPNFLSGAALEGSSPSTPMTKYVRFAEMEPTCSRASSRLEDLEGQLVVASPKPADELIALLPSTPPTSIVVNSRLGISEPILPPKSSTMGLRNPDDLKADPTYWQNKSIRALTGNERLQYKFKKLPLLRDSYDMDKYGKVFIAAKRQVREVKTLSEELLEDWTDAIEPLVIRYQSLMVRAMPYWARFRGELNGLLHMFIDVLRKHLHMNTLRRNVIAPQLIEAIEKLEVLSRQNSFRDVPSEAMETLETECGVGLEDKLLGELKDILQEMVTAIEARDAVKAAEASMPTSSDCQSLPPPPSNARPVSPLLKGRPRMPPAAAIVAAIDAPDSSAQAPLGDDSTGDRDQASLEDGDDRTDGQQDDLNPESARSILNKHLSPGADSLGNASNSVVTDENNEEEEENEEDDQKDSYNESKDEDKEGDGEEEHEEDKEEDDDEEEEEEEEEEEGQEEVETLDEAEQGEEEDDEKESGSVENGQNSQGTDDEGGSTDANQDGMGAAAFTSDAQAVGSSREASSSHPRGPSADDHPELPTPEADNEVPPNRTEITESELEHRQKRYFLRSILQSQTEQWAANPLQADVAFWDEVINQDLYAAEIIATVRSLCLEVEDRVIQQLQQQKELESKRLFGCEISVSIRVDPAQRNAVPGLHDLKASDIVAFLKSQLYDAESELNHLSLLQNVVDIKASFPYEKRAVFSDWSQYWVHFIHPSFFHYSAQKKVKKVEMWDDNSLGSISEALPPGLQIVNPITTFDPRTKQAFQALQRRPVLRPPGYRVKRTEEGGEHESVASQGAHGLLNLAGDDFVLERRGKKLTHYRPNMEKLTPVEIERTQRVYKEFKAVYDKEMATGLVNNALRLSQYEALKNLETAYRIYRTARQRYQQMLRRKGLDDDLEDFLKPVPLEITNIDHAQYEQWVEEVREEDRQRLIAYRAHAAQVREQLKQEARLRREAENTKHQLMEAFIKFYGENVPHDRDDADGSDPQNESYASSLFQLQETYYEYVHDVLEMHEGIKKELDKPPVVLVPAKVDAQSTDVTGQSEVVPVMDAIAEKKKVRISEEKKTRVLFSLMQNIDITSNSAGAVVVTRRDAAEATATGAEDIVRALVDHIINQCLSIAVDGRPMSSVSVSEGDKDLGLNEDNFVQKDKVFRFLEFVSMVLIQMDHVKASMQYAQFRAKTPKDRRGRQTPQNLLLSRSTPALQVTTSGAGIEGSSTPLASRPATASIGTPTSTSRPATSSNVDPSTSRPMTSSSSANGGVVVPEDDTTVAGPSEEDAEHAFFLMTIDNYDALTREEWRFLKELQWLRAIREHPPFFQCLQHMGTMQLTNYFKDELVQFASQLVDLYPLFSTVIAELNKAKLEAEIALGIHKKGKKNQRRKRKKGRQEQDVADPAEVEEEEDKETLKARREREEKEEREKQLEEIQKKAERDKAWFMAHPHRFLRPLENLKGTPFCIVCKEKAHEYWVRQREEAEATWRRDMAKSVEEKLDNLEEELRREIESEIKETLETEAEQLVRKAIVKEGLAPIDEDEDEAQVKIVTELPQEETVMENQQISAADVELIKWERDMEHIKSYLRRFQLSFVDGRGRSVLPPKPDKKVLASLTSESAAMDKQMERDLLDSEDIEEPPALKICVFHRNDLGERSKFLGMVELQEKELMKPPKGIRTYHLRADDEIVDSEPAAITGSLALTLAHHVKPSSNPNKPAKERWKLQLKKLSKVSVMDIRDLSNPYCEIFWKGPAAKNHKDIFLRQWTIIGQTKTHYREVDIAYKSHEDRSTFDLPPVWTDCNIPERGLRESDITFGGGFVARNRVPSEDSHDAEEVMTKSGKKFTFGLQASVEEIIRYRSHMKYKELLAVEIKLRSEARKLLLSAEERERLIMSEEEKEQRDILWMKLKLAYAPSLHVQENYAKEFQTLLEFCVKPSSLLARLRFLMGEDNVEIAYPNYPHWNKKKNSAMKGTPNSLVIRCADCSTNEVVKVICTPVLNEDDEFNMQSQVLSLVGKLSRYNMKVLDFAVHHITKYESNGFRALQERLAVIIVEQIDGPLMMDYLFDNWDSIDDQDFHQLLLQISSGLKELHDDGILHRNLAPHSVQLVFPKGADQQKIITPASKKDPSKMVSVKLSGYWFLENPRDVGCDRSQGRADWGYLLTTPPEVNAPPKVSKIPIKSNSSKPLRVNDRSDVYAFGVCVYYWATKGIFLSTNVASSINVESLKASLPLKWGPWLMKLLRMCLVYDPNCRASAREVVTFLKGTRF